MCDAGYAGARARLRLSHLQFLQYLATDPRDNLIVARFDTGEAHGLANNRARGGR
jgi:hypothetical protein